MDAISRKWLYIITVAIIGLCKQKCYCYDFRCPGRSEWKLKGNATCGIVLEYFCVLDDNVNKYIEFCKRNPDITRDITWKKGQKSVLRGNLDGEVCSKERYQPFIYRTDGNSECVYKKSFCQGEGMVISKKGSNTVDTQCRCDHSRGFSFGSKMKHSCYCVPSQEDCSCYKKQCKSNFKLSSDYICRSIYSEDDRSICSGYHTGLLVNVDSVIPKLKKENKDFSPENDINQSLIMLMAVKRQAALTVTIFTGLFGIIGLIIFFMEGTTSTDTKNATDPIEPDKKLGTMTLLKKETFREKLKVNHRDIINTITYSEFVDKMNLDEDQKKSIDDSLGLMQKNEELFKIVLEGGFDVYNMFIKVLRQSPDSKLADKIEETTEWDLKEENVSIEKKQENIRETFRKKLKANHRDIINTIKYSEFVDKLNLDEDQKKSIDDSLGLMQRNKELFKIVLEGGFDVYNMFIKVLRQSADSKLADKIEETTAAEWDLKEENVSNEEKQENIRDVDIEYVARWYKEDKCFTVTSGTIEAKRMLKQHNCVVVVGRSGNGKSAIIRHLALELLNEEGFYIFPRFLDPETILKNYKAGRNQAFIIDNFCGKWSIKPTANEKWSSKIDDVLKLIINNENDAKRIHGKGQVKLLFATDSGVFDDEVFKCFDSLSKYKVDLLKYSLTNEEKIEMIKHYFIGIEEQVSEKITSTLKSHEEMYPLLCKLSAGQTATEVIKLFTYPYWVIRNDLLTNKYKRCLFALCILLGRIEDGIFRRDNKYKNDNPVIKAVCKKIGLDLSIESTASKLEEELSHLEKNYFAKSGNSYQFVHMIIYDIAAALFGENMKKIFIKHAPSSFIATRYVFTSSGTNEEKKPKDAEPRSFITEHEDLKSIDTNEKAYLICIPEDSEKEYFNRLVQDLNDGITYSTFHNRQLEDESYRFKFRQYCTVRKKEIVESLKNLRHSERQDDKTLANIKESNNEYADYIDFKRQYHFASHKMKIPLIESAWEGYADIVKLLIDMEVDVNETDRFGRTALFVACQLGKKDVAVVLLQNKADHSFCDTKGTSPLLAVFNSGHIYPKLIEKLLEMGADASKCDNDGRSLLHAAVETNHKGIVEKILKDKNYENILQCDNSNRSALFHASRHGRKAIVIILLQHGAKLDDCDKDGFTPLIAACSNGKPNVVDELLKLKADITKVDSKGRSALFIACETRENKIVELLLNANADVSQCDHQGRSPLYIACSLGHEKIVCSLLQCKADISQCNEDGKSSIYIACEKGLDTILNILVSKCNAEDLEKVDKKDRSPLYVASRGGFIGIVKRLVSKGANVHRQNQWKMTPLLVASREGHYNVVQYLIKKGADLEVEEINGRTALSVACDDGNTDVVRVLIKNGAKVDHRDEDEKTPLELARISNHTAIVDLLKPRTELSTKSTK